MSYTIDFVRCSPGCTVDEVRRLRDQLEEIQDREDDTESRVHSDAEKNEVRQLVRDLCALDPYLQSGISVRGEDDGWWVTSEDERCRFPNIDVSYGQAMLSFSYGSDDRVFAPIRAIMEVFRRHGYVAFDPQINDVLRPECLTDQVARAYQRTGDAVVAAIESRGEAVIDRRRQSPRKGWWRFW